MSFVPYVDWAAHVAGLVGGVLAGMAAFAGRCEAPAKRLAMRWAGAVGLLGLFALGVAACYTMTRPPVELLRFCSDLVRPAYPEYHLTCYGN